MSQLWMVVKTFVFTFAIVLLMQYRWNGKTLENHTQDWIHQSQSGIYLENAAEGGAQIAKTAFNKIKGMVSSVGKDSNIRK